MHLRITVLNIAFRYNQLKKVKVKRFPMSTLSVQRAIRGRFLDIQNIVAQAAQITDQVRYIEDGLLLTEQGKITWFGTWEQGQNQLNHLRHNDFLY